MIIVVAVVFRGEGEPAHDGGGGGGGGDNGGDDNYNDNYNDNYKIIMIIIMNRPTAMARRMRRGQPPMIV